jgi:hypothetical protein
LGNLPYHSTLYVTPRSLGLYQSAIFAKVLELGKCLCKDVRGDKGPIPSDCLDGQIASHRAAPSKSLGLRIVGFWLRLWDEEGEQKFMQLVSNLLNLDFIPTKGLQESISLGGLFFRQWNDIARGVSSMTMKHHSEEVSNDGGVLLQGAIFR